MKPPTHPHSTQSNVAKRPSNSLGPSHPTLQARMGIGIGGLHLYGPPYPNMHCCSTHKMVQTRAGHRTVTLVPASTGMPPTRGACNGARACMCAMLFALVPRSHTRTCFAKPAALQFRSKIQSGGRGILGSSPFGCCCALRRPPIRNDLPPAHVSVGAPCVQGWHAWQLT